LFLILSLLFFCASSRALRSFNACSFFSCNAFLRVSLSLSTLVSSVVVVLEVAFVAFALERFSKVFCFLA